MNLYTRIASLTLLFVSVVSKSCFDIEIKWKDIGENQYVFIDSEFTWYEAYDFCKCADGVLATIESDKNNGEIANALPTKKARYWIGLNSMNQEGKYIWLQKSTSVFTKWEKGWENIDTTDKEKCAYFNGQTGFWKDAHCEEEMNFICMKSKSEIRDFPVLPESGNCPADWYKLAKYCYKLFDTPLNWKEAKKACRSLEGVADADLTSIHYFQLQMLLTSLLKNDTWIGGSFLNKNKKIWADNSRFDYEFSPVAYAENSCIQMNADDSKPGQWGAANCTEEKPYICRTYIDNVISEPPTLIPEKCEHDKYEMTSYKDSCYYLHDTSLSWNEGQKLCQSFGARLASILDAYENAFINFYLSTSHDVWFAIRAKEGQYKWLTEWPLDFTNWMNSQPVNSDKDLCGLIDINSHKWKVAECEEKHSVLCKLYDGEPEVIQEVKSRCPDQAKNWKELNLYCYKIFDKASSWSSAAIECLDYGSELISFHSRDDVKKINPSLEGFNNVWIGLFRPENEGYKWQDESAVDFVNWKNGPTGEGGCVEITSPDQFWKNDDCANKKPFVCGVKKILSTETISENRKGSKGGLSPGQVALICVAVILIVFMIITAVLWKKGLLKNILRR